MGMLLFQITLEEDSCTLIRIVDSDQIKDEVLNFNPLPFIPIQMKLFNYFYPMMPTLVRDCHFIPSLNVLSAMATVPQWLKARSGSPAALQYFINRYRSEYEDYGLILFNEGTILRLPDPPQFCDIEIRKFGGEIWKNRNNVLQEDVRMAMQHFLTVTEPLPIKLGIKRLEHRETKAEMDFLNACLTPGRGEDDILNKSATEDAELEAALIEEWQSVLADKKEVSHRPIEAAYVDWKFRHQPSAQKCLSYISEALGKISFAQGTRISFNTKVKKHDMDFPF